VREIAPQQNPATWMLEVIGAGTSAAENSTDFHAYYTTSALAAANAVHTEELCRAPEGEEDALLVSHKAGEFTTRGAVHSQPGRPGLLQQCRWVGCKVALAYWRPPSYNLARMVISVVVALIFASAYANQQYSTDNETVSRSAVIYITW
jgi:hypothetical protein